MMHGHRRALFALSAMGWAMRALAAQDATDSHDAASVSPIKHVIVIIGENRSFDHIYATYQPRAGQSVSNLLSRAIVTPAGSPGHNYLLSAQRIAQDTGAYAISPAADSSYAHPPPPGTTSAPKAPSDRTPAPFATLRMARQYEPDLPADDYPLLLSGATGLDPGAVDTRVARHDALGAGVFQLTPSVKYDDYAGNPVHRFYQMWQQSDCAAGHATRANPSGCLNDLFTWVNVATGAGSNGEARPSPFTDLTTGQGAVPMAFYNMHSGDAPYMKLLADRHTLSDNMHQSVQGGTGVNHIMFGFADDIWYSDVSGQAATPPAPQIENPNAQAGTNNWYSDDGYAGGSYSACSDLDQPGVASVVIYLRSLSPPIDPRCEANHYYLLNNYDPGFNADGTLATNNPFTIPPTSVRHIGDVLMEAHVSFSYFGEGWNSSVHDPAGKDPYDAYCNICNPFQYATDIMTDPVRRAAHIHDTDALYLGIADGTLPAVSIVKPSLLVDGHPASSKLDLFEGFTRRIIDQVRANPTLWRGTAIFVTFDEGGGYYDSGYIQPLDFFGDGTRIPLLIVSPYSEGGIVNHAYADHVSIIKFIERNWRLPPITARSRDNFPNPTTASDDPYVPLNSPAISDLWDAFRFPAGAAQRTGGATSKSPSVDDEVIREVEQIEQIPDRR
jgi:phospholipase C